MQREGECLLTVPVPVLSHSLATSLPITNQGPWLASRDPLFTTSSFKNVRIMLGPFLEIPLPMKEIALSAFRNVQQRRLVSGRFSFDQKKSSEGHSLFLSLVRIKMSSLSFLTVACLTAKDLLTQTKLLQLTFSALW